VAKGNDGEVFAPRGGMSASEERDRAIRHMIDQDRAATDAKTARLRAQRLAQEDASESQTAHHPPRSAGEPISLVTCWVVLATDPHISDELPLKLSGDDWGAWA
jgi:hypothetical protein